MTHDPLLEAWKPGLQILADAMHLSLANAARFHAQRLKLVNESLADTAAAMKEIDGAQDFPALLGIQARLTRSYLERSFGGWKELWEAAGHDQVEAFRQVQTRIEQAGARIASEAPGEAAPAVAALRSLFDAACETYARSAKTVEEMTRMASAHASAAAHAQS